jgi:LPXTG-motif cell wall-anchored protein
VTSDIADVKFIDENGNVNNDRVFAYGVDATMNAKAFDRTTGKEITGGTMTYFYTGIQTDGQVYYGDKAPTYPGAYTVIAIFVGENKTDIGTGVGALAIEQKNSDFALYDNTVTYDGNEHFVKVTDSVGFQHIYVVVDADNNVNVILPKDWNVNTTDAMKTVEDLVKAIKGLEVPAELAPYYADFVKELNNVIAEIDKEIDVKSVMINGKMPIEVGEYDVYGLAFGKADYKVVADSAVLVIEAVEEDEPETPKDPEEPKDPTNPEDPKDPTDPEDPTKPSDPKDPEDDKDDDKDDNDSPQTGDNTNLGLWIGLASASLIGIIALLFVSRKRKSNN